MSRLSRIGETAQRHQGKEGKSDLRASGGVCCGVGDEDSQVHGTPDDAKSQALERVMATIEAWPASPRSTIRFTTSGCKPIAPGVVPWESAQELLARCIAAYPTLHPLVEQFRAVGVSRPVDLTDLGDRAFALGVIEGWAAQVGEDELPLGIGELANALRDQTLGRVARCHVHPRGCVTCAC